MTDFAKLRRTCGDDAEKWAGAFASNCGLVFSQSLIDWFSAAIEGAHDARAKRRADRGYEDEAKEKAP